MGEEHPEESQRVAGDRLPEDGTPADRPGRRSGVRRAAGDPRVHAASWALLVAVALFATGPETGSLAPWLRRFEALGGDKLVHGVLFGGQSWLLARALAAGGRPLRRAVLLGTVLAIGYGGASELAQSVIPGRSAQTVDFVADVAGAVAGAGAAAFLVRRG